MPLLDQHARSPSGVVLGGQWVRRRHQCIEQHVAELHSLPNLTLNTPTPGPEFSSRARPAHALGASSRMKKALRSGGITGPLLPQPGIPRRAEGQCSEEDDASLNCVLMPPTVNGEIGAPVRRPREPGPCGPAVNPRSSGPHSAHKLAPYWLLDNSFPGRLGLPWAGYGGGWLWCGGSTATDSQTPTSSNCAPLCIRSGASSTARYRTSVGTSAGSDRVAPRRAACPPVSSAWQSASG